MEAYEYPLFLKPFYIEGIAREGQFLIKDAVIHMQQEITMRCSQRGFLR